MYNQVQQYAPDEYKDQVAPKPTVPRPSGSDAWLYGSMQLQSVTSQITVLLSNRDVQ